MLTTAGYSSNLQYVSTYMNSMPAHAQSMGYNTIVAIPATVKLDSRSRGKKTRTEETSGGEGNKNSREVL